MDDHSYTAVYVPEYTGHHPSASILKSRLRLLRRCWFRLSRLQKSILFMFVMVILIFTVIVSSSSWIPEEGLNNHLPLRKQQQQDVKTNINSNNEISQQEQPLTFTKIDTPILINNGLKNTNNWDDLNLAKDGNNELTQDSENEIGEETQEIQNKVNIQKVTVSSSLPSAASLPSASSAPVSSKTDLKSRIAEQTKENLRAIINSDPAIPLGPKKSTVKITQSTTVIPKDYMRHLKFDGPQNDRQREVVRALLHAWNGYKNYSWGYDHLQPISRKGQNWFGLGLTIVDSLDTLYIMGLNREFYEARDWVEDSLHFGSSRNVNLFETTIRVVGGLLSAYHLSGDKVFMEKANELGSILFVGFNTQSGVPYSDVNLRQRIASGPKWNPDSTTSEVSTIQLEFRDLSRITGNPSYENAAMNVSHILHKQNKVNGLVPIYISPNSGKLRSTTTITLGARGDSYYEYLLKQWIQTGKKIDFLRDDYLAAIEGIRDRLLRRTVLSNLTYLGELEGSSQSFKPKMDHLVCYLPGTLALGHFHGLPSWHMDLAKELIRTCYLTYKEQPTGLAPEITYFKTEGFHDVDFYVKPNDAHNLLRPETVESLWYLYSITGDKMYQDWGWNIFTAFLKYTKVDHGFTSINSVLDPEDTRPRDMMESFFLAETLKYLYLLFEDKQTFDLNYVVFNTEAHPLPVYEN